MGGGASKRALLQEELQGRTNTVTDETSEMVKKDQERRRRKRAATTIQAYHRGNVGRSTAQARRDELARAQARLEHHSAARIQARVRGKKSRAERARKRQAALLIQRRQRGRSARVHYQEQRQAATRIQASFRGQKGRRQAARVKQVKREYHAAEVLQSVIRRCNVAPLRELRGALLVQRRYRYLRACGNWDAAVLIRRKEICIPVIQRYARSYILRSVRRHEAMKTNRLVKRLLDSVGLSRLWPKWGHVFSRPGSTVDKGNTLTEIWAPHHGFGGWSLTYDQMLGLREKQVGGRGLPGMPRVDWGLNSADRARLFEKIKIERPRWAKDKLRFEESEAEKLRENTRNREANAAIKIQAVHRGRLGRREFAAQKERARRSRVPGWKKIKKMERAQVVENLTGSVMAEALLRAASRRGDKSAIVETLKIPGLVIDAVDGNGRSAFYLACMEGYQQIAKLLMMAGAKTQLRDHDGSTPFMAACHEGKMSVVRWLHNEVKVDTEAVEDVSGCNAFLLACQAGQMPVVQYLAEQVGVDLNVSAPNGITPMYIAAYTNNLRLANYVNRLGFSSHTPATKLDGSFHTPLAIAERKENQQVHTLIKKIHAREEKRRWDAAEADKAKKKRIAERKAAISVYLEDEEPLLALSNPEMSAEEVHELAMAAWKKMSRINRDKFFKRAERRARDAARDPTEKSLGLSRAEIRAIEMWVAEEKLNPFGDPFGHVYVRAYKGEFLKSERPNGFTDEKESRLRYIVRENSHKPWARFRAEAKAQSDQETRKWRRGKGAFLFGKRAFEDKSFATTVQAIQKELGVGGEVVHTGQQRSEFVIGDATTHDVANKAFECIVDKPAYRQVPSRADAIAGGWLADNGEDAPVSYLEKIDIACRATDIDAAWSGRNEWIQRGGRTTGELKDLAMKLWQKIMEAEAVEADEYDAPEAPPIENDEEAHPSSPRSPKVQEPKGPPRRLVAPIAALPDREKHPAYYDIVANPIDMEKIKHKASMASYGSVLAFRDDLQTFLFNARVTGGRGTQLWDDITTLEDLICKELETAGTRLPYHEEVWPEWNTIPPELYVKDLESDKLCTVMYNASDTIADVKYKMSTAKQGALKTEGRRLIFKGCVQEDPVVLSQAGIDAGATLRNEPWIRVEGVSVTPPADEVARAKQEGGDDIQDEEDGTIDVKQQQDDRGGMASIFAEDETPVQQSFSTVVVYFGTETTTQLLQRLQKDGFAKTDGYEFFKSKDQERTPSLGSLEVELGLPAPSMVDCKVFAGDTLVLSLIPEPEEEPTEEHHDAATLIQAAARGRRARRAVDFVHSTNTGKINFALFRCVMKDDVETLNLLMQHGGDWHAKNPAGHTMIQLARERGRPLVCAWLKANDPDYVPTYDTDEEEAETVVDEPAAGEIDRALPVASVTAAASQRAPPQTPSRMAMSTGAGGEISDISIMYLPESEPDPPRMITRAQAVRMELDRLHSSVEDSRSRRSSIDSAAGLVVGASIDGAGDAWAAQKNFDDAWRTGISLRKGALMPLDDSYRTRRGGQAGDTVSLSAHVGTGISGPFKKQRRKQRGKPNPDAPFKRKHIGTLAALVTEPLHLVHSEQPGTEIYMDPMRGNLAMQAAIRAATRAVPRPKPPRILPEPKIDYRGLDRLAPEKMTLEQGLESLSHGEH